ncbi:UDP-2,4-diacetamido-2,4,6-trideoxy-beta-L-altropyranose hydrolase [Thalassobacillus sp. B23F22_16]|uniref:UDP-2,4-diacetamido-2,4, 6-trideoxy-beta-L-altropyranose hydrolase n=1 Tax=Thalassobacillus sp. B23F22_16 TaxID=3459513 RepID=UPI00373E3F6C
MNVCFRVDSSRWIGTGHVMRCLVLAEQLQLNGAEVTFVCRRLPGDLTGFIENRGYGLRTLPSLQSTDQKHYFQWFRANWKLDAMQTINFIRKKQIDWLVTDHYAIDEKWEQFTKPYANQIMVIDDLADRPHNCKILLDQNFYPNSQKRYEHLVGPQTIMLLGPKYFLLREEFKFVRQRERDGSVTRILISFGGSDPTKETLKALKAVQCLNNTKCIIDVVIGKSNLDYVSIKSICADNPNFRLHYQIDYIAELMAKADLSIGAGGSTTWERCYLSLPAITIETAENQSEILYSLSKLGAVYHLGTSEAVDEKDIARAVKKLMENPCVLQKMIKSSKEIMKDFESGLAVRQLLGGSRDE